MTPSRLAEQLSAADELDLVHPFVDLAADNEQTLRAMDDTIADIGQWRVEHDEQQRRQQQQREAAADVASVTAAAAASGDGGLSVAEEEAAEAEEELRMLQAIERVRQRKVEIERLQLGSASGEARSSGATPSNAALAQVRLQAAGFGGLDDDLEALEALRDGAAATAAARAVPLDDDLADSDALQAGQIQAELEEFDGELADALRRLNIADDAPVEET